MNNSYPCIESDVTAEIEVSRLRTLWRALTTAVTRCKLLVYSSRRCRWWLLLSIHDDQLTTYCWLITHSCDSLTRLYLSLPLQCDFYSN